MRASLVAAIWTVALATQSAAADVTLTEGTNLSIDVASDGRIVTDLLGGLWMLPRHGGEARALASPAVACLRPRFSPDGTMLVFEAQSPAGGAIRLFDVDGAESARLGDGRFPDRHPEWHPDGERITFSSARGARGFDLWEVDLATGLEWRLTARPGDESEPAWSHDGRHLVYVHQHGGRYALVLRRHGQPDAVLDSGTDPLAAPSWRPDGSLITYLKRIDGTWAVWMTILSSPPLHRPLIEDDDVFIAPVAWLDRQRLLYAAGGKIRERRFNAWRSTTVPFRARVDKSNGFAGRRETTRNLRAGDRPRGRTVIRAARVFDGVSDGYRERADIVIEDGIIVAIEDQAPRSDAIVIDLGDITVLPGYVDAHAALPVDAGEAIGPLLLGLGVTTMVTRHADLDRLDALWRSKEIPGPRLLPVRPIGSASTDNPPWLITVDDGADRAGVEAWQQRGVAALAESWKAGVATGASLLPATATRPASPAGRRYQDVLLATGSGEVTLVSGLADAATPGVDAIADSRVAREIGVTPAPRRRVGTLPDLSAAADAVVVGSKANGLPPGVALHAELRALVAAGLAPVAALRAAGANAAAALGIGDGVGRLAPGGVADFVIVDGDPLRTIDDAQNIVAVVANGRFYSISGLIDRAAAATNVGNLDKTAP